MYPVKFAQHNRTLMPPEGMEDKVNPLYVYTDGRQCISVWELTDHEIEAIIKQRRIYISVLSGLTQPPIYPSVDSPFENISSYVMISGGPKGVTLNGKNLIATEVVNQVGISKYWGVESNEATWLARNIIQMVTMNEISANTHDLAFRKTFLDNLVPGAPFEFMVDVVAFIRDAFNDCIRPKQDYLQRVSDT